ncbi:ATP-dependent protease [Sphingomonas koreensis]|jgi:Lon protease-like protein|uniref:ATP-dependent protease n=1 Tax=Sphingomonas koreensis TaxID=93064 RepID=A0A1L6J6N3_9SPHN|nr:LON peptidase substrate-binding domain-containing protein [Sphingomonas koreensis]APR51631.1 ATP-dependent protease [Sphingomonas koreensis]MDC7811789.1 LON peptidase substrate-binding domain-containing protein [Sphingomonas koreensis]RSU19113.1 ATP-dependent protease [Sphingomonas koreensis]RSU21245.1 ATP-dependent protease [Sphingomonas koreensis]RSU32191.1 ATP-dependent protease [Sphingomonas koreensis]
MTTTRLSVFPLAGALLFPRMQLPLHIFEPRYRAMVTDSLARDRRIGMIQPRPGFREAKGEPVPLFEIGCVGRIAEVEALNDGKFDIVLEGLSRFRVVRELEVTTPFRQIEAELIADPQDEVLGMGERASLELESRRFAERQGYAIDWSAVSRLDDEALVNGIAQIAPFDPAAKQALLEASSLSDRAELTVQLMQFFGRHDSDEGTLQ